MWVGGASGDVTDVRQSQTGVDVMRLWRWVMCGCEVGKRGCVKVKAGVTIMNARLLCTLVSRSRFTMAYLTCVVGFVEMVAVMCGSD
eukprot:1523075-Amphidinium_carterae.1